MLEHYSSSSGADRLEEVHWTPEHMASWLRDLHIAKIRPALAAEAWVFASEGACPATAGVPHGLAFVTVTRVRE